MNPGSSYIFAVGNYTFKENKAKTCTYNGQTTMYAAYACLKPGDAVVKDGHIMLVSGVDHSTKRVMVVHQSGGAKYFDGSKTTSLFIAKMLA